MTPIKKEKTTRKFNLILKNPLDINFHQILKIFKDQETITLPIFYPGKRMLNSENDHKYRRKSLVMVEKNLFSGKYTKKPWRFIQDVNEAFETIKTYHSKQTKTYIVACEETFSCQMDNLMKGLGYCCGRWYVQKPRDINCSSARKCEILTMTVYYRFEEFTFCETCFKSYIGSTVNLGALLVQKTQFIPFYFNASKPEEFVRCSNCNRKMHEICVFYQRVSGETFHCKKCRRQLNISTVALRARKLPATECDTFISQFLVQNNINENGMLTIRAVSNVKMHLKERKIFHEFRSGTGESTYRNCTLFSFFDSGNDIDLCFFSVMFQLFDDSCPKPNRNSAYISYIDSINLLQSNNRTKIYRLILIGLFAFLKTKGFKKIFLWSCPPKQNQDYVFYKKPPRMKMPTKSRLTNWYHELVKMGRQLDVIDSYSGIMHHASVEGWNSLSCVPYMEGDLWVIRMEEAITQVKKEIAKLKDEIVKFEKKSKTAIQIGNLQESLNFTKHATLKEKELEAYDKNARVWELISVQIEGFNSEYFVILLSSTGCAWHDPLTETNDKRLWINSRHLFIDFFWGYMLEFSSERRAKFSTYSMLYRIFVESKICANCSQTSAEGISGALLCRTCNQEVKSRKIFDEKLKIRSKTNSPVEMIKVDFHDEPELNHNKIDYQSTFENFLGKLRCSPSFSVCEQNIDTSFESDNSLEVEFVPEEPAF